MDGVIRLWAGKERLFRLRLGNILDVEAACDQGVGSIFLALGTGRFHVQHVHEVLRHALIGGGASVLDAKRLLDRHFDATPLMVSASLAGDILSALMTGIEPSEQAGDDSGTPAKHNFGDIAQLSRLFNVSPNEIREMRYADFVNMVRRYNEQSETKAPTITEAEFIDILNRYEPVDGGDHAAG